jgi:hypothetical protein
VYKIQYTPYTYNLQKCSVDCTDNKLLVGNKYKKHIGIAYQYIIVPSKILRNIAEKKFINIYFILRKNCFKIYT